MTNMMTRRSFWSKALGTLGVGASMAILPSAVGGTHDRTLPLVGQGGIVPMYFIDSVHGKDHAGFPYQDCPHKTLNFMNEDSPRHRQWILYGRSDRSIDPQYAEAWEAVYGPQPLVGGVPQMWSQMR